ncbi:MAG: cell division topological specificity factor MinE [Geminicoccaceae bacterium]|nr:cell division topological specificity factor MinE [Geminicoccaceae bacterium]MCB9943333.1 cell division topological specificity factor MinE [Geminicoccaceae bacterium]
MRLFDFFKLSQLSRRGPSSADTAKQRLQVLVALDRKCGGGPDFLPLMQKELIEVIRKYVEIDDEKVNVDFQAGTGFSTLEVNIEIPGQPLKAAV